MIFFEAPAAAPDLMAAGATYALSGDRWRQATPEAMLRGRLVCDWSIADSQLDRFVSLLPKKRLRKGPPFGSPALIRFVAN